jgi:putative membrane protein
MRTLTNAVLLVLFLGSACEQDTEEPLNAQDQTFVTETVQGNRAEIEIGQLAADKSGTLPVKEFGRLMVNDHGVAQSDLKIITDGKNLEFRDELDAEHLDLRNKLLVLDGYDFDTAYINSQIRDHRRTITRFETELKNGKDQQLKDYANKHLSHIRKHLEDAITIAGSLEH